MNVEDFAAACDVVGEFYVDDDTLAECRDAIRAGIKENFERKATSDGASWPPRKKPGDGHPLLDESGALKAAATSDAIGSIAELGNNTVTVGVEAAGPGGLPGARRHQYGDDPPGIRQREFIGISDAVVERCGELAAQQFVEDLFSD